MKIFFANRLMSLFFVTCLSANTVLADNVNLSQNGLFWQIDKPGLTPSYILGSIHSDDPRVTKLAPIVRKHFEQADSVSLELIMDKSSLRKSARAIFLTEGNKTLDQLLGKELFEQVIKAARPYKIPITWLKRFKPWGVIAILSFLPKKNGQFLDLMLYKEAKKRKKRIYALESIKEQLYVFESFSLDEQIILLKDTLKNFDKMPNMFDKFHELYLKRDLTALMELGISVIRENKDNQTLSNTFYKRMIDDRNLIMVERMQKVLKQGNAFIAIGALHLPGENGILQLLKQQGYQVLVLY
jgi:uncharacterized protein YbaP (TraB family)